ncbi:MAG: rod shape-determining protein MreD [Peptococcaceae bacterium]|nr:MAG: rod shape-determining protein MreD [Peptococcaceae bacterium]
MHSLILLLLAVIALILQATMVNFIAINGVKPDLVMLFIIIFGFLRNAREGAFWGFCAGLLEDLFVGNCIGLNAISKLTAGYLAGLAGSKFYRENQLIAAVVTLLASIAGLIVYYLLLLYLNIFIPLFHAVLWVILPVSVYTACLAPLLYKRFAGFETRRGFYDI